jgi:hypothetical protein
MDKVILFASGEADESCIILGYRAQWSGSSDGSSVIGGNHMPFGVASSSRMREAMIHRPEQKISIPVRGYQEVAACTMSR